MRPWTPTRIPPDLRFADRDDKAFASAQQHFFAAQYELELAFEHI